VVARYGDEPARSDASALTGSSGGCTSDAASAACTPLNDSAKWAPASSCLVSYAGCNKATIIQTALAWIALSMAGHPKVKRGPHNSAYVGLLGSALRADSPSANIVARASTRNRSRIIVPRWCASGPSRGA
jgi:hypothetical protein